MKTEFFLKASFLKKISAFLIFLFIVSASAFCQTTSWTGTTSTNWSTSTNWTNGVPTATVDAIIGDANFTGSFQPTFSVTSYCNNLVIGGAVNATLTANKTVYASGNITINSGSTITHTAGTISTKGSWTNNGTYTGTISTVIVKFITTGKSINGTSVTNFQKLTINSSCIITSNVSINVASLLTVSGTFIPAENATPVVVSGAGGLTVGSAGVLKVNAATYGGNYALSGTLTLTAGNTIEYGATLVNQTIKETLTYSTLKVSGALVKTLGGSLPDLVSTTSSTGRITVSSGTLDLSTFTANRGTAVAGGTLTVSNGATLRIGGTDSVANYLTYTLGASSTVEYYGNNQSVAARTYGNLIFSGTLGTVVKTLIAKAFTVAGNFTTSVGTASSLSFTAAAVLTFNGNINIGASTTFYAGSFSHPAKGNWINNGTVEGNTSTFTCSGAGKSFSGSGTYNFNNLTITGAGNTASGTTNISVNGTLTTSGSGTFTHTTGGILTMNGTSKSITGTGITFSDLTCTGTITTASTFTVSGNLSVTGSLTASAGVITLNGSSKNISGSGVISLKGLSVSGSVTTTSDFSIGTSLNISGTFAAASPSTATFTGTSTLNGTANLFNVTLNGTSLQLSTSAVLGIANAFTITAGSLNVTSTTPNTVNYNGTVAQTVTTSAYNNLVLSNGNTKTAAGALTVNGDFTIAAATTFNASSFTHAITGNFTNNGTFTASTSTINFTGASDGAINGATTFNTLTVNKTSASGKVTLSNNISVVTANMTNGSINTGTNTLTITAARTGNGIILGTIQRTHTFTAGVAYAFEGPNNTITFSSVTGVTSVSVTVTRGIVTDFPYQGAINRMYDISIPAGTYNATLRLHYETEELNGNGDATMKLWKYNSTAWITSGSTGSSSTSNYIEQSGLTNISNRWTASDDLNVAGWNGSVSSDWSNPANWSAVQGSPILPPSGNVIAAIGYTPFTNQPTISTAAYAENLIFGDAQAATLTLAAGGSLTSGNISGNWTGGTVIHTINTNGQTITVNGEIILSDGTAGHAINVNIGTGTINIAQDLTQTGGANVTFTGNGTLNIGDDFNYINGTFTGGTGTVNYNGTIEQIGAGVNYNNITINKTAGIAYFNNAATIAGNLSVDAGELDINAASIISGNVTLTPGATLSNNGIILTVGGNWNNNGNYISSNGSIIFNGSGAQSIASTTFNNLTVNKTSGTATLTGNLTINGNLSITSGTLDLAVYTCNRSSAGGNLSVANNASLLVAGTDLPSNFSMYSLENTSTINYNGTIAQNVAGITYGNLVLSNGSTNAKTFTASATVNGDMTINTGAALNAGTYTISLNGNWTNGGTFTPAASTVILNGIGKTITGNTTFNNVTANGSYTAGNSGITFNGDLLNYGSITYSGTITLSGTVAQTLVLNTLVPSANSVFNFNGTVSPVFNSTLSNDFSTVNINNTAGITPVTDWNVSNAFNISNGATFNGGSLIQNISGSFTNNGTATSSGTLNYTPSAAQTVQLRGTSFTSTGNIIFGGTGAITVTSTPTTLTDITISNTAGVSPSAGWTIGRNFTISSGAIFNAGSNSYTVAGDIQSNGTLNGGTSTFTMSSPTGQISGSSATTFNNFTATGTTITVNDNFNVSGNLTTTGTLDATGGTVIFTGSGNSIISGATTNLAQFNVAKNTGGLVTLARNITGASRLDIISGTLDAVTYTITQDATAGAINNLFIRNNAALKIGGTNTLPSFTKYAIDSLSTVEYNGTTQTIASISSFSPYGNLTISAAGTKTANGSLNIRNNFTLTNGTFVSGAYIDTLGGNWNMASGTFTSTGSTIVLNGAANQDIFSAGAFNNLTLKKSAGSATLSANATINGILTFTLGKIQTGSFTVIVPAGGSVSGAGQTTGWVYGKLQKNFASGINVSTSFEVGGNTYYTPAVIAFASVTTAGNLTANVTNTDHPDLSTSGININKSVNRYFTFSNNGIAFTTASVTLNWVASDVDAGSATANFKVKSYNGTSWNTQTVASPLATSIQATGVTGFSDFAIGELATATTWTGITNSNWNDQNNWNSGVPTSATGITIPSGLTNYPVINAGTIAVKDVTIQTGAALTVSAAAFQVSGIISNSGTFTATNGSIEMIGTSGQTIAANTFASNTIKDLIITNAAGVSLAGTLNLTNTISFGNINNSTFTTGGYLTLVSNAAGTARVGDISNGGTNTGNNISGNVTVHRFIPAKRAFRFLTPAVNTSGSVKANWMENTNNSSTSVNNNPVPNFGTHITGSGGNDNGFDQTQTNNPSLFSFNNATQAWVAVTNTGTALTAGTAYRIMVRGSRSTDLSTQTPPPSPTTLRATGTLVTGTVLMTKPGAGGTANMPELSAATNGYSFIGNPYASPMNWLTLEKTDLSGSIYIFDPTIAGANGRGGYVSYNGSTGNSNPSSQVDNNIQSGQAFFVQTAGSNPSLTFREQYKTGINRAVFRTPNEMPHLTLQLLLPEQDSTGRSADGLAAYFSNDFDSSIGDEDSYKFTNEDENIAIMRNGKLLSIEGRKPVNGNDTLPLKVWQLTKPNYTFKFNLSNFDFGIESFLEDSYLHSSTKLNNNAVTMVPFTITTDPASAAPDRFRIVFTGSVTLAVPFAGIKAFEKNKGVEVAWTAAESNIERYEVERSADARVFVLAGSIKAKANENIFGYTWFDANAVNGDNFYRIKAVSNSEEINYSKVVKVTLKAPDKSITVYPNPVHGNAINIFLKNMDKANYRVSLVNSSGQTVFAGNILHAGDSGNHVIKLNNLLAKGSYQLQVSSDDTFESISISVQ